MTLAHPWLLLLLAPAALAAWWVFSGENNRQASAALPADETFWRTPASARALAARWGPDILRVLCLGLVAVALAGPQALKAIGGGMGQGIDIMLVVDTSLSMSAIDFNPQNRLEAAIDAATHFIQGRTSDQIGLVNFGGAPQLSCPMTTDYGAIEHSLDTLTPGDTGTNGTAIGDAIVSGLNHLKEGAAKSKVMILLTDGRSNTGLIDPMTAAALANQYGVKIYTIGCAQIGQSYVPMNNPFGGKTMVPIGDDLDEPVLKKIADETGGLYFRASSKTKFAKIYDTIDKLEKSEIKQAGAVEKKDLYRAPTTAAAALFLAAAGLASTLWLRWP